jgi:PAS domain S-box-containing protein
LPLPSTPLVAVRDVASVDSRTNVARPAEIRLAAGDVLSEGDALSADETREMSRLTVAIAVIVMLFALASIVLVLQTGDPTSAAAAAVQVACATVLVYARRQLLLGRSNRGVVLTVGSTLAASLVMATIPPPVPALAAAPIMAVAFALSYLHERRLKAALITAWVVSLVTAIIVEFTPPSPDLPPEFAAASRVGTFAAVVGLVALILYRHRRRLEEALSRAQTAGVALRDGEERYRTVVEDVREVIFRIDGLGRWTFLNHAWEELTGHRVADSVGLPGVDFVHPDDREVYTDLAREVTHGGRDESRHEFRLVGSHGADIWVEAHVRAIHDDAGRFGGMSGTLTDMTVRRDLEEQLRVSQKMEAIGGLAGGVAHDFNNLLAVILSYTEFAIEGTREGDPLRNDLQEVKKAAERAAALTRQLLAFSRKQLLQPVPVDLNRIAAGVEPMLRRIIGEDIDLVLVLAPDLGVVRVDPGQIEQVLMNLVVNARDAMPQGGTITIETCNVEGDAEYAAGLVAANPGPHVQLAVTDTGLGMDEQTRTRMFDPFFTTKEVGKGTGLGLSTVYGIVRQSGGHVWVSSEPDQGTSVRVRLPRELGVTAATASTAPPTVPRQATGTGTETILVAEDEEAVREVARRILGAAGYTVLTAAGGGEALLTAAGHAGCIDLLLTDVVMPRMGGRALADELWKTRPSIKVLYMSGHTDDTIAQSGALGAGTHLINKPFSAADLTRKVREVLDGDLANPPPPC